MINLTVVRKWISEKSTIGELLINGKKYCFTLELPWKDNEKNVSCIPEGEYKVIVDWSNSKKTHLPHVLDVTGRDGIRIHIGNFPKDIQGCILVGERKEERDGTGDDIALYRPHARKGAGATAEHRAGI